MAAHWSSTPRERVRGWLGKGREQGRGWLGSQRQGQGRAGLGRLSWMPGGEGRQPHHTLSRTHTAIRLPALASDVIRLCCCPAAGTPHQPGVVPTATVLPIFNSMALFKVQPGRSFHSIQARQGVCREAGESQEGVGRWHAEADAGAQLLQLLPQ